MPDPTTQKGVETRQKLVDTALTLFADRGYDATTMRAIAEEAGVSTGLAYRYFASKEELVVELYARLSADFVDRCSLPEGRWVDRGLAAIEASFDVLRPHRRALAVLLATSHANAALYPPSSPTSPRVERVFAAAVADATNAPRHAEKVGEMLYLAHLGVLLFWVLDRSDEQVATARLRSWVGSTLPWLDYALLVPGVMAPLDALLDIVRLGILGKEVP